MSESKIVVRRIKPKDVPAIAGLLNASRKGKSPLSQEEVRERILQKGYRIAVSGKGAAAAGWQTENLVTLVDDFYVYPNNVLRELATPLVEEVEKAARELACEAVIFFLEKATPEETFMFFLDQGYMPRELESLHTFWQEVAKERISDNMVMMVKQLSDQIRMEPL